MSGSLAYIKLRCLGHQGFSECKDSDCCSSKSLREWRVPKCCIDLLYHSITWGSQKTWLLPFWTAAASKGSTCQGCFGGHWLDLESVCLPAYQLRKEQAGCDVLDSSAMDHSETIVYCQEYFKLPGIRSLPCDIPRSLLVCDWFTLLNETAEMAVMRWLIKCINLNYGEKRRWIDARTYWKGNETKLKLPGFANI